jgi:hypothetical protein
MQKIIKAGKRMPRPLAGELKCLLIREVINFIRIEIIELRVIAELKIQALKLR